MTVVGRRVEEGSRGVVVAGTTNAWENEAAPRRKTTTMTARVLARRGIMCCVWCVVCVCEGNRRRYWNGLALPWLLYPATGRLGPTTLSSAPWGAPRCGVRAQTVGLSGLSQGKRPLSWEQNLRTEVHT